MRGFVFALFAFLLFGCSSKELTKVKVADMVANYYTPYSSTNILVPQKIDVLWIKQQDPTHAQAKVCYTFRFLTGYNDLVEYMKKHPKSFLARFDFGLVALLGKKFDGFKKGDIKSRCDIVTFERKYNKWVIRSL